MVFGRFIILTAEAMNFPIMRIYMQVVLVKCVDVDLFLEPVTDVVSVLLAHPFHILSQAQCKADFKLVLD